MNRQAKMLAAALDYAASGLLVFPAPPGTKMSFKSARWSGGRRWGATCSAEEIERDWARWPQANVAICTGGLIFVTEIDTPKGHSVDGFASLAKLEAEHGPLPATLTAESPSGSRHFYWRYPSGGLLIRNSAGRLGPGIDVRGEGGMVIAPPSVRKDGEYRWLNDLAIAHAP